MPGTAVELDDQAVLLVPDVSVYGGTHGATACCDSDLPHAGRKTMGALDLAQVDQLQERLNPLGGVPKYVGKQCPPG